MVNQEQRLQALKLLIEAGVTVHVIDASAMGDTSQWCWGDLEKIGFGRSVRHFDNQGNLEGIERHYIGPGSIRIVQHNFVSSNKGYILKTGDVGGDV